MSAVIWIEDIILYVYKKGTINATDSKSTEESDPLNEESGGYGSTRPQMLQLEQSLVESETYDIELTVSKKRKSTQS